MENDNRGVCALCGEPLEWGGSSKVFGERYHNNCLNKILEEFKGDGRKIGILKK